MFTIRKQFKFEMAHQLCDSYTIGCQNMHGHSYILEVFLRSETLDETGMIIDFGEISDLLKNYIEARWDHALVMPKTHTQEYLNTLSKYNKKMFIVDYNPTAENMARYIFNDIKCLIKPSDLLYKVRIHETVTGWAEYIDE